MGGLSTPHPLWVLRQEDVYCYDNLPDLTPYIRQCFMGDTSNLVSSVFGVVLLHQKHKVTTGPISMQCALVNMAHGLMLGLYPYNMRKGSFELRVAIAGLLRLQMTTSPLTFLKEYPSLVTLSAVEYIMNVLPDYCPVEHAMFQRLPQSRMVINNICEQFRAQLTLPLVWSEMEAVALGLLPFVTRQMKFNCHRLRVPKLTVKYRSISNIDAILDLPVVRGSVCLSVIALMCPGFEFSRLEDVEALWSGLAVHSLPQCFVQQQQERLISIGSCSRLQHGKTVLNLCVACAFRTKVDVLQQQFAWDCGRQALVCVQCSGLVLSVCMVGRLLHVVGRSYSLCVRCLSVCLWGGGSVCGCCTGGAQHISPVEKCEFCYQKNIVCKVNVIDVHTLQLLSVSLCARHAKRCVQAQGTRYDMTGLELEMIA